MVVEKGHGGHEMWVVCCDGVSVYVEALTGWGSF